MISCVVVCDSEVSRGFVDWTVELLGCCVSIAGITVVGIVIGPVV